MLEEELEMVKNQLLQTPDSGDPQASAEKPDPEKEVTPQVYEERNVSEQCPRCRFCKRGSKFCRQLCHSRSLERFFSLRHFGHLSRSRIKFTITVFTCQPFRTLWPDWRSFFRSFQTKSVYYRKDKPRLKIATSIILRPRFPRIYRILYQVLPETLLWRKALRLRRVIVLERVEQFLRVWRNARLPLQLAVKLKQEIADLRAELDAASHTSSDSQVLVQDLRHQLSDAGDEVARLKKENEQLMIKQVRLFACVLA